MTCDHGFSFHSNYKNHWDHHVSSLPCLVVVCWLVAVLCVYKTASVPLTISFANGANTDSYMDYAQVGVVIAVQSAVSSLQTDDQYICATLDWWPPEKCDYGACSWDHASLLNLNLTEPLLKEAIKAFSSLKIRLGGSLQDNVIYDIGHPSQPCKPFLKDTSSIFGFSGGCLTLERWDELLNFFQETQSQVVFGLNALYGRKHQDGIYMGPWNSSNAQDFIQYTVDHGFPMNAWELGNELSGVGVGTKLPAKQYAADVKELKRVIEIVYKDQKYHPLMVAPDGFVDAKWFSEFFTELGPNVLDVMTHHIYNLGSGVDAHLEEKILSPFYLNKEAARFILVQDILRKSSPRTQSWVGEAGGVYNSGRHLVTDVFLSSFWYLDQLGMAARFGTRCYCRQSLIGGNYGLLNTTTFQPNPDYYSALLWHRLMGKNVLMVQVLADEHSLRAYAHCSKDMEGITLLIINFNNEATYLISASIEPFLATSSASTLRSRLWEFVVSKYKALQLRTTVPQNSRSLSGCKVSQSTIKAPQNARLEYHLSSADGDLRSQAIKLNGMTLNASAADGIPDLIPLRVDKKVPIAVEPLSIVFVSIPGRFSACLF